MAWGTPVDIGSNFAGFAISPSFTVTSAVGQGQLIVIVAGGDGTDLSTSAVTDSKGNTYLRAVGVTDGNRTAFIFYAYNVTALTTSDTITFNPSFTLSTPYLAGMSVTGTGVTDPVDNPTLNFAAGSAPLPQPTVTSGAPSATGDLFVATVLNTGGNSTDPAGWSHPPTAASIGSRFENSGYRIDPGSSAQTYAPTLAFGQWVAAIAGFMLGATPTTRLWPLPPPGRRPNPQDWMWGSTWLVTQPPPPPPPPTNHDWPVPRGPRYGNQDFSNQVLRIPAPVLDLSARQYDWPLPPRGPRRNPQDFSNPIFRGVAPTLSIQARQNSWPLPGIRRAGAPQDWIAGSTRILTIVPPPGPSGPRETLKNETGRIRMLKNEVRRTLVLRRLID